MYIKKAKTRLVFAFLYCLYFSYFLYYYYFKFLVVEKNKKLLTKKIK